MTDVRTWSSIEKPRKRSPALPLAPVVAHAPAAVFALSLFDFLES